MPCLQCAEHSSLKNHKHLLCNIITVIQKFLLMHIFTIDAALSDFQ